MVKNLIDATLEELQEEVLRMFELTIKNHKESVEALLQADNKKAVKVIERDDIINHLEEQINYTVMVSLAKYQPMAKDLRRLIAALKISNDLERIGDYAKSIAKTAIVNTDKTFLTERFLKNTMKMSNIVVKMLENCVTIINEEDVNAAYKLASSNEIDEVLNETLKSNPFDLIKEDNVESYVLLMGVMRNLERARDHINNICEAIIFIANGTFVEL
ncbi:phosphate signaling complex protein PhoU [Mycoplasma sp. P36-A1]|uniref:phosphate signaling complex protein PhoU n=1 Tax=Mycoplasma sp. P36-A1 TaxID=3252900 RepID=UPI003C2CDD10